VPETQGASAKAQAVFTGGATLTPSLITALAARGLPDTSVVAMPLSAEVTAAS